MEQTCPTCGVPVRVAGDPSEGTASYVPLVRPDFPSCQAVGCNEPAQRWGYEIDAGVNDLMLSIRLCRRHERDLIALTSEARA